MTPYTKETKRLFQMLVLGGLTMERRRHKTAVGCMTYAKTQWYITLPLESYLCGPFESKTTAVLYAAEAMEIDQCLILQLRPTSTRRSRSASPSAALSSFATSPDKQDGRLRASPRPPSKMPS